MKSFCKDLKERATKTISYEKKKEIITITIEEKSYRRQKTCHICKKEFSTNNEYKKTL